MISEDAKRAAETLAQEGADRYKQGNYDGALAKLNEALALDQDNARALGTKGSVLRLQDRFGEAERLLHHAARLAPDSVWILAEWGETLRILGRHKEALKQLEQALDLDPDNAFALGITGAVLFEQGHFGRSLRALDQALALDPDYAFALGTKATVLAEMDRYREALTTLAKAPPSDPNYRYVLAVNAQLLCDTAYYEPALRDIDEALRLGLENIWTFGIKGWALQNLDDSRAQEAPSIYEGALSWNLDQTHEAYLRTAYGRALSLLRDETAEEQYKRVLVLTSKRSAGTDTLALSSLAWCHYGLGQYEEAVELLIAASSLNKGLISAHFDIALVLMCGGRQRRALKEYGAALRSVEDKHPLRRRGLLHVALRDLEAAAKRRPELATDEAVKRGMELLRDAWQELRELTPPMEEMRALSSRKQP
jgi:tetratricopeptide (TPR) repeat protein